MTINRTRLNWGVFLIVLGAVPLAYDRGIVSLDTVSGLWRLWPLILIGIGLGIVLSRTPAAFVGGLTVAACLGLVVGSLLAVGPRVGCGWDNGPTHAYTQSGTLDPADATVTLDMQCGSVSVAPSQDGGWHVDASLRGNDPTVIASGNSLTVRQVRHGDWSINRGRDDWKVALPSSIAHISVSLDAGDASFRLGGLNLTSAAFSTSAGSLKVDLSESLLDNLTLDNSVGSSKIVLGTSNTAARISNSVGSTEICAPSDLGLSIHYTSSLGSDNFAAAGLALVNGAWRTAGYDGTAVKADLTIDNSVGSVTLNPAGGCK